MTQAYEPPCTLTSAMVTEIARIAEVVGEQAALFGAQALRLRRVHRVRTIHGSLAIEGNTLSEAQITGILEGKRVVGPEREVREARNAIEVYERLEHWQPGSLDDLLAAHAVLMAGLAADAGKLRSGGVGVVSGKRVVHMAPPAKRVPELMRQLFGWMARTEVHPLIVGSLFHYELEFIHPFSDGNGRMGRLWQTLILSRWSSLFVDLPVESLIHARQSDYYEALAESNRLGDAGPFVALMLEVVSQALHTDQVTDQVTDQAAALLRAIGEGERTATDLLSLLGLSHRPTFRENYLDPALAVGLIERTQPDTPRSPTQKYRLTTRGRRWLAKEGQA
jgi:Fic family protein